MGDGVMQGTLFPEMAGEGVTSLELQVTRLNSCNSKLETQNSTDTDGTKRTLDSLRSLDIIDTVDRVDRLLIELTRRGVVFQVDGTDLIFHPKYLVSPKHLAELKALKPTIIERLFPLWPVEESGPARGKMAACTACGSLELWQSLTGNWHCQRCRPPTKGLKLLAKTSRIRSRLKPPPLENGC
jgi:hypothetical protein